MLDDVTTVSAYAGGDADVTERVGAQESHCGGTLSIFKERLLVNVKVISPICSILALAKQVIANMVCAAIKAVQG